MKAALLLFLLVASVGRADESDEPPAHFFAVPSPSDRYHVVQTVRGWDHAADVRQFGRLQMFETDSGREVWRLERTLAYKTDVFPADDGEHLVLASYSVPGGRNQLNPTATVLSFYAHGHLLKSYSLQDLHIDPAKLEYSVSHLHWFTSRAAHQGWHWEWPLGSEDAEIKALEGNAPNPRWYRGVFALNTLDGQILRFDPATGNLLPPDAK